MQDIMLAGGTARLLEVMKDAPTEGRKDRMTAGIPD